LTKCSTLNRTSKHRRSRAPKKSKTRKRCVNICLYCMHMYWRNVRLLNNVQSSTRSLKPRLGRSGLKYVFIACICINEMFDVVSNKQTLAVKGSKKSKTPERRVNIYLYCTHMYWRNVRLLNNVQSSTRSSAIEGLKSKTREGWVNICLYCMHVYWRNNRQTVTSRQHSGYVFIFSPYIS